MMTQSQKNMTEFEVQSPQFVKDALHAISANWSPQEAMPYFSEQLVKAADWNSIFPIYAKLGALKSLEEPVLQSTNSIVGIGTHVTGVYSIRASFEHDDAVITLQVFYKKGKMTLNGLYINAPMFQNTSSNE